MKHSDLLKRRLLLILVAHGDDDIGLPAGWLRAATGDQVSPQKIGAIMRGWSRRGIVEKVPWNGWWRPTDVTAELVRLLDG